MSKRKPVATAILRAYSHQIPALSRSDLEHFPAGGGWGVTVTRGERSRAAAPDNIAKRDAAVADLKQACQQNKVLAWGTYENQRSTLNYTHDDVECRSRGKVFHGAAAKLARGQLACGCNRQAAASRRSLDLSTAVELAEQRGGALLSASYQNNARPLQWKCAQTHEFSMTFSDAARGRWCPQCAASRANVLCKLILERMLNAQFVLEQTPPFLAAASEEAGLPGMLRFDGWCEAERIAFEHQGPQHYEPIVRSNTEEGLPDIESARLKHLQGKEYDAIKAWACARKAALIVIPDLSVAGYGHARSNQIINNIVWAVRAALPAARLDAAFEAAVNGLYALDRAGWQELVGPMFAGSTRMQRLRELAESKGGRLVSVIDDRKAAFECQHGHRWVAQINNVLSGTWCPKEGVLLRVRSRRLTIPALRERLKGIGLRLEWDDAEAEANYKNNETPIPVIRLACSGRFVRPLNKLHDGSRCAGCKGKPVCNGQTRPRGGGGKSGA